MLTYRKRLLLISLVVIQMMLFQTVVGYAAQNDNPNVTKNTIESGEVIDTVTQYFTKQLEARKTGIKPDWTYLFDVSKEGQNLLNYETGKIMFRAKSDRINNSIITWYSVNPDFTSVFLDGSSATVIVSNRASVKYSNSGDVIEDTASSEHKITLINSNARWKIVSDQYDDLSKREYGPETDWSNVIADLSSKATKARKNDLELEKALKEKSRNDWRLRNRFGVTSEYSITGYTALNRSNTAWYGTTYTDNSGTSSTTYYNKLFKDYNYPGGGDCQNFVSQAIWYGFGGQNNSTAINGHYSPMIDKNAAETYDWWADAYNTDDNWMWVNVDNFKNNIINNYDTDKLGVQGHLGSLSYSEVGDYLYKSGHVMLITAITDYDSDGLTDFNEIYVSAHNVNYKNERLSDFSWDGEYQYMWIAYYKS